MRTGKGLRLGLLVLVGLAGAVFGAVVLQRRFSGPVTVRLETQLDPDLPFTVEMIPPEMEVEPGEVVNVIYRVRNESASARQAIGRVEIAPGSAVDQIRVYLTECGGLNTYAPEVAADYYVTFKVEPAGLFGTQVLTIRHVFEPGGATP